MPPPDQVIVVKAIAFSGLAEWKELLGKFVERMPARHIVIDRYLYGKLPVLRDLPLDNPIAIDANWGYYFATGSSEPIQRLVRALAWSRDKNNVEKLTARQHGKWALAQLTPRATPSCLATSRLRFRISRMRWKSLCKTSSSPARHSSLRTSASKPYNSIEELKTKAPKAATSRGGAKRDRRHSPWAALARASRA